MPLAHKVVSTKRLNSQTEFYYNKVTPAVSQSQLLDPEKEVVKYVSQSSDWFMFKKQIDQLN